MKIFDYGIRRTDARTHGWTTLVVKSLSRLKREGERERENNFQFKSQHFIQASKKGPYLWIPLGASGPDVGRTIYVHRIVAHYYVFLRWISQYLYMENASYF